jgi:hypothetical protein
MMDIDLCTAPPATLKDVSSKRLSVGPMPVNSTGEGGRIFEDPQMHRSDVQSVILFGELLSANDVQAFA